MVPVFGTGACSGEEGDAGDSELGTLRGPAPPKREQPQSCLCCPLPGDQGPPGGTKAGPRGRVRVGVCSGAPGAREPPRSSCSACGDSGATGTGTLQVCFVTVSRCACRWSLPRPSQPTAPPSRLLTPGARPPPPPDGLSPGPPAQDHVPCRDPGTGSPCTPAWPCRLGPGQTAVPGACGSDCPREVS